MNIKDKKFNVSRALTWALLDVVLCELSEGLLSFLWGALAISNLLYIGVLAYSEYIERKQNETTNKA